MHTIKIKRIYLPPEADDGYRILVDRLWPRGIAKAKAAIDLWAKEIAPSTQLRQRFKHNPEEWPEFKKMYFQELDQQQQALQLIIEKQRKQSVTLLFAAKDEKYNNAQALKEYLILHGESKK